MWKIVLSLTVGCLSAQDYLTGDNVCKVETTAIVEETVVVPVTKTARVEEWCMNIPPRCFKYVNKTVNELQTKKRQVKGYKTICCLGFVQQYDKCVPPNELSSKSTENTIATTTLITTGSSITNSTPLSLITTQILLDNISGRAQQLLPEEEENLDKVLGRDKNYTGIKNYQFKTEDDLSVNTNLSKDRKSNDDSREFLHKTEIPLTQISTTAKQFKPQEEENHNNDKNFIEKKHYQFKTEDDLAYNNNLDKNVNKNNKIDGFETNNEDTIKSFKQNEKSVEIDNEPNLTQDKNKKTNHKGSEPIDKKIMKKDDKEPHLNQEKDAIEQKIMELNKKINDLSDVSYINNHDFSDDYDINLAKSHFEKSSKITEVDEATVELHLTTSKNVLLGFVFMIAVTILIIIFVVAFFALKCITVTQASIKNNKPTSIFNVPLPDPPGNVENLYEPIKENHEAIILSDLKSDKFKYNTLGGHYRQKGLNTAESPFFNTLPSAPRSVSYHGHKSKPDNTFELINPDQVAYDVPPSDTRRFSSDYNDDSKRMSMVSYVDMQGSYPLYVNHIKRQHFSTFLNQKHIPDVSVFNKSHDSKTNHVQNVKDFALCSNDNVTKDIPNEGRVYSNDEVTPFLTLKEQNVNDVLQALPGFKNGLMTTYTNEEEVTSFQ